MLNARPDLRPFFAMIFLTLVVWAHMYARRIPFIQRSRLRPDQLTPLELARVSPLRFALYAISTPALWLIAIRAALQAF